MGGAVSLVQAEIELAGIAAAPQSKSSWYAIQVRGRCEKVVADQLQRKGIETFVPLVRELHRWSDRMQVVDVPLFPSYGFARLPETRESHRRVLETSGVIGFVSSSGKPSHVPEAQIESVRLLLSGNAACCIHPFVKAGQPVRIRGGCLDGVEGTFLTSNADSTLVVSIDAIQRSVAIQIKGYVLEPI